MPFLISRRSLVTPARKYSELAHLTYLLDKETSEEIQGCDQKFPDSVGKEININNNNNNNNNKHSLRSNVNGYGGKTH
jgi:undecaprenyl pyrophosphate synthase